MKSKTEEQLKREIRRLKMALKKSESENEHLKRDARQKSQTWWRPQSTKTVKNKTS